MKYFTNITTKLLILLFLIECTILIDLINGLRNNVFGTLDSNILANIGLVPTQSSSNSTIVLTTTTTTTQATTIAITSTSTSTSTISTVNPTQTVGVATTGTSFLSEVFQKPSLEQINKDIKDIMQKESSNNNLGICIFTSNPYLDLGYRETNYSKCTKFLLSFETWLDSNVINTLIQEEMTKFGMTIPSKKKFNVPSLEVLFNESFLQVCVNFFVELVNSGSLYINNNVCTGTNCHDQFNSICSTVSNSYGKSAFVLGSSVVTEVVNRICQESRRQISAKYPTLIASPSDIRPDNVAVEVTEPIPT
ncbi:uncharacterized protein cubi_03358 [Cryptosporidium ubiquitum]|uniref:Uncharacterized protein n=1 Tax=Cryptosporidium ubiquitum TaxID=857276 RepID=A0A1J4MH72_9CRYT|nr:uncharacterized protein cubi_03358 [Cryptosporidium ubiquitum]OII73560.1 hypothetical protein cubi_03358 [Cryptosporidium ubiquitum]